MSDRKGPRRGAGSRTWPLAALLAIGLARPALAAIALDAVSSAQGSTASLSWSHTVGSGQGRILIVGTSHRDGNKTVSGVTYATLPLTRIGVQNGAGNSNRTELWYLLAPASGTGSIVVALSGSVDVVAGAASFVGVDQSSPLGTFASGSGTSTTASATVVSALGGLVVGAVAATGDAVSLTSDASMAGLWNQGTGSGGGNVRGAGATKPGAASVTLQWTLGASKSWAAGAVPLMPETCPGWSVTTTADTGVPGTLRECIRKANASPGQTITVPAGTYTLAIPGRGETAGATGDLDVTANMSIVGAGAGLTIINPNGLDRAFHVGTSATASLSGVTIMNGAAAAPDATLDGGGILSEGTLTLTDVAVTGNGAAAGGGGVYNKKGALTLVRVTVSGNTALNGGGIGGESGTLSLVNVTAGGNSATGLGGGLYNKKSLVTTATNCTIAGNSGATGGNIAWGDGASFTLKNTLVANATSGGNCSGVAEAAGSSNNLDSANTCGFNKAGDRINTNPLLGGLASNGGTTQTMALLVGSPAIDAGTNTGCPATDQRGVARPFGALCDIGAFEFAGAPPSVVLVNSVSPGGTRPPGTDLAYTVTFTNGGGSPASSLTIVDALKTYVDFKLGSPVSSLGTTGLTLALGYSNDGGATFTYTPASAGGGAPAGYDRNVTHVRWVFTGTLSPTAPNNTGSVGFTARIR